ncbi:pentatricopeptide repeat-containing protein At1g74600, chloroplastic [Rhodamnia argentea]|uniref:Pentatricopeptide repeat-containing protein At1g74600, chloroplastic n=1 Tax=Rhodamnia argentea TaxID=178133 RepID=A0ABM3HJQ2_9MYRT|nr:pentatricopeptide repeat-containing protein At1g74600, chloroplastic [Rhodamnia argentea]XP_048136835.1 pentatricopeptide repeat-containing protein At1g74600, chloroplastic [Rhodamnia argentea]
MKSLFRGNIHEKVFSSSAVNLNHSLAVIDPPSIFDAEPEPAIPPVHRLLVLFNDYTKSRQCTTPNTKIWHAQLLKSHLLQSQAGIADSLMDCYRQCDATGYALKLFDAAPQWSLISWNTVISSCNKKSLFLESWKQFCRMHKSGFEADEMTYGSVISACTALQAPPNGMQVYSLALRKGFHANGYVRAGTIDLLAKNYKFDDALRVFHDVSCENVVCWNTIIAGAVRNGENRIALDLFRQLCCHGTFLPNSFTFPCVLTACAMLEDLETGKVVHGWIIKCGSYDVYVSTSLSDLYAKCRDMEGAMKIFNRMRFRNVVSWTAMISGFVQLDDSISAVQLFKEMRSLGEEINTFTITSLLSACGRPGSTKTAAQFHSLIIKCGFDLDPAVGASLMNMYYKVGAVDSSELIIGEMERRRNPNSRAVMISLHAQANDAGRAIELFVRMLQEGVRPDKYCTSSLLSVVNTLSFGRQVHSHVIKSGLVFDVSVASSLFTMYSKCDSLAESYEIFGQICEKDNVSWTSMIAGFANNDRPDEAVRLFRDMLIEGNTPDQSTFIAILTAIRSLNSVNKGEEVHAKVIRLGFGEEITVGGALVMMYSRCGYLKLARRLLDLLPLWDGVACSTMISGYAQNGYIEEALLMFHKMLKANFAIDSFSISSVVQAVTLTNRSDIGTQLQSYAMKVGLDSNAAVGSSLVAMYSKIGGINDCVKAFDQIDAPDLIGWTAMIMSYARHGIGEEALRLFELMKRKKMRPDPVTFVGVLSACSHSGLVEEGYFHFDSMVKDYGIEPNYRHYACMVDLLGRSGGLKEAERFISNMPIAPNALVWETLLAACKIHGDIELGKLAAKMITKCEPSDAGAYISLSNMYADMGQWEEVMNIRSSMKGAKAKKEPGWSVV